MLKQKKHTLADCVLIPFKISPVWSTIIVLKNMASALIPTARIFIIKNFIETASAIFKGESEERAIYMSLFLYALTIIYNYVSNLISGFVNIRLNMKMTLAFKSEVIKKRASLEYCHIENDKTWELITRASDVPHEKMLDCFYCVIGIFSMIIEAISVISVLAVFVWWAALPIIIASIPVYIISVKRGKKDYIEQKDSWKYNRRSWTFGALLVGRDNIEERAMFGYSKYMDEKWYELFEKARKIRKKLNLRYFMKMRLGSLLTLATTSVIAGLMLIPLSNGELSLGTYTSLLIAVSGLENIATWRLTNIMYRFSRSNEYLKDLSEFVMLSESAGTLEKPETDVCNGIIENIEFKNVSFSYPGTEIKILDNLSFTMSGDKHYSFVGKNGAGKTTITKLLVGLYNNYEGEIFINGKNLRDYTQAQLKGLFSIVYQDYARYEVTLRESVALGNLSSCCEQEVINAVKSAGLDEEVQRFANGIDTPLGKTRTDGTDVSGGQWQRIAIARTLVSPCPIHILDEPTAALDPISERKVYELFGRVSREKRKMTIYITHRLGAARLADEVLVLDNGMIIEHGSHDDLVKRGGLYASMFEAQKSWYEEEVNV